MESASGKQAINRDNLASVPAALTLCYTALGSILAHTSILPDYDSCSFLQVKIQLGCSDPRLSDLKAILLFIQLNHPSFA